MCYPAWWRLSKVSYKKDIALWAESVLTYGTEHIFGFRSAQNENYIVHIILYVYLLHLAYIILVQEHVELSDTDSQVCLVEFVRNVPSEGTKLSPLLYNAVEETQTKEQLLERFLKWRRTISVRILFFWKLASTFLLIDWFISSWNDHCNAIIMTSKPVANFMQIWIFFGSN